MPNPSLPKPDLPLTRTEARRFLLAHQHLWPPRALEGKPGILDFVGRVGCIQYDPIDVTGRNADLVLQARIAGYRPALLEELLYADRLLWDGWDKVSALYLRSDWPYFGRQRARMVEQWGNPSNSAMRLAPEVRAAIRERGPLSPLDLKHRETLSWTWGTPARLGRAALETLWAMGELGIHHRTGTRRTFDLVERLLPPALLTAPDPNQTGASYQEWHVRRRVGGLGLALGSGSGEYWQGILGVKGGRRAEILNLLVERGDLLAAEVESVPGQTFFLRSCDLHTLDRLRSAPEPAPRAALMAPLDNLLWDRSLLRRLFGFDFAWEVYKPQDRRRYGYYVLPVLYGDRFVARCEPVLQRKEQTLQLRNWWWEERVQPDSPTAAAVCACLREFAACMGAERVALGEALAGAPAFRWLQAAL